MSSNWLRVSEGSNHRRIGSNTEAVCYDENVSVDIEKITAAQSKAGHQALNHAKARGGRKRLRISSNCGAGRGLRQGWSSGTKHQLLLIFSPRCSLSAPIPFALFHAIVRRFFCNDDVMHVALAQSRGGDSNKPALLFEFL